MSDPALAEYDEWAQIRSEMGNRESEGYIIAPKEWEDSDDNAEQIMHNLADEIASGVLISRQALEAWGGRELSDDEVDQLRRAIPHSSIPDAINVIVTEALGT